MQSKHSQFIPCCANIHLLSVCINRRKILRKRSTNNKIWPFACDHRLKLKKPLAQHSKACVLCDGDGDEFDPNMQSAIFGCVFLFLLFLFTWALDLSYSNGLAARSWHSHGARDVYMYAYKQHSVYTSAWCAHLTSYTHPNRNEPSEHFVQDTHTLTGTRKKSCREKQQRKVKLERKRRRKWWKKDKSSREKRRTEEESGKRKKIEC